MLARVYLQVVNFRRSSNLLFRDGLSKSTTVLDIIAVSMGVTWSNCLYAVCLTLYHMTILTSGCPVVPECNTKEVKYNYSNLAVGVIHKKHYKCQAYHWPIFIEVACHKNKKQATCTLLYGVSRKE